MLQNIVVSHKGISGTWSLLAKCSWASNKGQLFGRYVHGAGIGWVSPYRLKFQESCGLVGVVRWLDTPPPWHVTISRIQALTTHFHFSISAASALKWIQIKTLQHQHFLVRSIMFILNLLKCCMINIYFMYIQGPSIFSRQIGWLNVTCIKCLSVDGDPALCFQFFQWISNFPIS